MSFVVLTAASAGGRAEDPATPLRGTFHTSWVGNSFGGDGGGNGFGYWVQNGVDEIEVTPDGTVIAGVSWERKAAVEATAASKADAKLCCPSAAMATSMASLPRKY